MALIIKGGTLDSSKPKVKKFLAIGTGESTSDFIKSKKSIPDECTTIGMHRTLPYLAKNSSIRLDYWTWIDPDAALEGLELYGKVPIEKLPTIIIPEFLRSYQLCQIAAKHSSVAKKQKVGEKYNHLLDKASRIGKLEVVVNSKNPGLDLGTPEYIVDPSVRFKNNPVVFGYVSKGSPNFFKYSKSENRFTSTILPLCHYLGATEVYNLGFDNQGKRITGGRSLNLNSELTKLSLEIVKKWKEDWHPYHKMSIFSLIPDEFTNLNKILEKKNIDDLT
jgi:hypothetical protein